MKTASYFKYFQYFNDLKGIAGNYLWVLILIFLLTSVFDSIGITLVIPLLESTIDTKNSSDIWLFDFFENWGFNQSLNQTLLLILFVFSIKGLFIFGKSLIQGHLIRNIVINLKIKLRNRYEESDYRYFISKDSGFFINVLNTQSDDCIRFMESFSQFSSLVLTCLIYMIAAFSINFKFSVILIIYGAISQLLFRQLSGRSRFHSAMIVSLNALVNKLLIQLIQYMKFIRATGRTNAINSQIDLEIKKLANSRFKVNLIGGITQSIAEPLTVVFLLGIIYYQVSYLGLSILPIMVVLMLFYRSMNLWMISQQSWINAMGSHGGLTVIRKELTESEAMKEKTGDIVPVFNDRIKFQNVNFKYGGKNILNDVNLEIWKNQTVAFVGSSGSGKTTIVDLLHYLITPQSGTILLDQIPFEKLNIDLWRSKIGYVSQQVAIFDDTVKNNIAGILGDQAEVDMEKVKSAAILANCFEFIEEMENGFETMVGERGLKLSGGQSQRLAIAREIYKEPELLILDEATSALDSNSELLIKKSLDKIKGQMTVVIVAHRFSTIKLADVIFVIREGGVAESGKYAELTKTGGVFSELIKNQS